MYYVGLSSIKDTFPSFLKTKQNTDIHIIIIFFALSSVLIYMLASLSQQEGQRQWFWIQSACAVTET